MSADNSARIGAFNQNALALRDLALSGISRLRQSGLPPAKLQRLTKRAAALYQESLAASGAVPPFTSACS